MPSAGITVASGFPVTVSPGIIIGGEDFSRFPVAAGTPALDQNGFKGLRMWPADSGATNIFNDVTEGNYFDQNTTNANHMLIENFSNQFRYGEILCRIFLNTAGGSGIRVKTSPTGPVFEHSGSWQWVIMSAFSNSVSLSNSSLNPVSTPAGTGVGYGSTPCSGFGPCWFWVRMRYTDQGGGNVRVQIHPTFGTGPGTVPAVPGTWDIDEIVSWVPLASQGIVGGLNPNWGTRLGWLRTTVGPTQASERAISYFAFSTDQTYVIGAPEPPDILTNPGVNITTPAIIAVDPLQGTWCGLEGDPYSALLGPGQPEKQAIPSIITTDPDVIGCWEYKWWEQEFDEVQNAHQDISGNGTHLYWGDGLARDAIIGDAPFSNGKRAIIGGGSGRALGVPNTAGQLNAGAAGEDVRVTVNFTADLITNQIQSILAFDDGTAANRGWTVTIAANTSDLVINLSEDGFTTRGGSIGVNLNTVFSDWDSMWLRFTLDFTADTITVESSPDGVIWSPYGIAIGFGANLAGLFQVPNTGAAWFAGSNNGGSSPGRSLGVSSFEIEEDSGGGFATVYTFDALGFTELSTLQKSASQGSVKGGTPEKYTNDSVRLDSGNGGHMETYDDGVVGVVAISDQFDVAPGEVLTLILVSEVDWLGQGGTPGDAPLASRKVDSLVASEGWGVRAASGNTGLQFLVSDGVVQNDAGFQAAPYPDDWSLNAGVFEIDGPDGELRMRNGSAGAITTLAYDDGGTIGSTGRFSLNRWGAVGNAEQDFLGAFVIKRELTVGEMSTIIDFLSFGRLS